MSFTFTQGSGSTAASDVISTTHYPKIKIAWGTDGNAADTSATNPLPVDTELPTAAALSDAASNPTTPTVGAGNLMYNGSTWDRIRGDTTNGIDVDVTRVQNGQVAHDSAITGSPIHIGAEARTTEGTAVASADAVRLTADTLGRLQVIPYALLENLSSGALTSDITNTSDTQVIAAAGAGIKTYITSITVSNADATVSTWVNIKDGSTTKLSVYAAAAGGGATIALPTPIAGTANTAWNAACETTSAEVRVSLSGFKSKI